MSRSLKDIISRWFAGHRSEAIDTEPSDKLLTLLADDITLHQRDRVPAIRNNTDAIRSDR